MFSQSVKKAISLIIIFNLLAQNIYAATSNPNTAQRVDWNLVETNTSHSGTPTNVKYFKFYDVLPDDVTEPIYKDMNLDAVAGKKLFVGYGTAEPDGNMCRYFPELGRTECLPWWRIEREYAIPETNVTSIADFVKSLNMIYPPKTIKYCKEWKVNEQLAGGRVTCTSYYDKRKSVECMADPEQTQCFMDQCSNGIKTKCTLKGSEKGETTTLQRPMSGGVGVPVGNDVITGLTTHQYNCPSGYMPGKECRDWVYGVSYPYECKAPTSPTSGDGEYIYCDSNPLPYYDAGGELIGFTSTNKCSNGVAMDGGIGGDGKPRMCPVNSYSQTQKVCEDPIMEAQSTITNQNIEQKRTFKDYDTSVLFGDEVGDIYSGDPLCLRLNSVEGSRQKNISVRIVGSGNLDDDIYVMAHKPNSSYNKIYCNMQHNEASSGSAKRWVLNFSGFATVGTKNVKATLMVDTGELSYVNKSIQAVTSGGVNNGSVNISAAGAMSVDINKPFQIIVFSSSPVKSVSIDVGDGVGRVASLDASTLSLVNKNYAGDTLQCIDNDGSYSFDQTINIESSDVVSIQQASEAENNTKEHMFGRNHFRSSPVTIDGVLAAPPTFVGNYPNYPNHGGQHLKTWDNALTNLSIMFPYAGAYEVYVYGGSSEYENKLIGSTVLTIDDFKDMPANGFMQLKLGKLMELAPGMPEGDNTGACRNDDLVDWGGGVWSSPNGSAGGMSGCAAPNDGYAKANKAYNIVVKDLFTGIATPVKLVYPLPYPNRIFFSKLSLKETRKYRCYDPFPDLNLTGGCTIGAQNEQKPVSDYRGHTVNLSLVSTIYCDVVSEKMVGCNKEKTIQREGGFGFANANEYETKDNSNMFMNALAGAQLSEQMMHIWSGWPGYCDHGTFTDFSWTSDPLALASLAMSAYGSAMSSAGSASSAGVEVGTSSTATVSAAEATSTGVGTVATAAEGYNVLIEAGKTISEIANGSGNIAKYAQALQKLEYWTNSLGYQLVNAVSTTSSQITAGFTNLATNAANTANGAVQGAVQGAQSVSWIGDAVDGYNTAVSYVDNTYKTVKTTLGALFTNPATSQVAESTAQGMSMTQQTTGTMQDVKSFMEQFEAYNKVADVGFTTINWTTIAGAGYNMYAHVEASRDDMIKAWKAQQAYVLSGEGTANDISANAYSSCMASVGSSFINTISIAAGARDANVTSQELLQPWNNPLRISFQSLYELKDITGDAFMETSYRIKDLDYNMQMVTIVAMNSAAYSQLTQLVCGGYNVAKVANAVNHAAAEKPSMIDGLKNMSGKDKAMMAASTACMFAGPYAFACALFMKLFSSFSSGNACTDEKIAQSQKPIQLKTNKFQKFGQCHHKGGDCAKKWAFGCMLNRETYCCYDQIMTRIFAEGIKAQRGTGWGSCNDITINDLKDISFTPCEPGQDPKANKCFPRDKYNELSGELKKQIKKGFAADGDTFMQQVQNAMEVSQ